MMDSRVEILNQTQYNHSFLASGGSIEICIVRALDVSWVRTIGFSARVHRKNIGGTTAAKYEFLLYGANPSPTDGTDFITAAIGTSDPINGNYAAPGLVTLSTGAVITDPAHPFLRVVLKASNSGSAVNLYAELSATLVLGAR
jgi:hypothetical protein